jgi:ureidoacrylate peracid hydrolase
VTHVHRQPPPAEVTGRRVAIVVIDVQNDYCHPDGAFARAGLRVADLAGLVAAVNRLTTAARAAGHPVVWVKMVWNADADAGRLGERSPFLAHEGLRRGTWGAELVDGLDVAPEDAVVEKRRFSAFYETDLEARLNDHGATTLVTAGVRTDFCVESTVRDAMFRDFEVLVPREAVAGYVPDMHEHSLRLMDTVFAWVLPLEEILSLLAPSSVPPSVQEV